MVEYPLVADVVETVTDVALQNPLCTGLLGQHTMALINGVGGRAFRTKTIGVGIAVVCAPTAPDFPFKGRERSGLIRVQHCLEQRVSR